MGKVRIIEYEGSDEQILKLLTQGVSQPHLNSIGSVVGDRNGGNANPTVWEAIAKKFHKHVTDTAAWGRPGQQKAMVAWLQHNGGIELTTLWKSAGVRTQHDFGGIAGSLTKNMKKSGGPREWFRAYRNAKGEWVYQIVGELVAPLRSVFGLG